MEKKIQGAEVVGRSEQIEPETAKKLAGGRFPSRSQRHPSQKGRWTRIFFQSLVLLFVLLIAGLIVIYKRYPSWFGS